MVPDVSCRTNDSGHTPKKPSRPRTQWAVMGRNMQRGKWVPFQSNGAIEGGACLQCYNSHLWGVSIVISFPLVSPKLFHPIEAIEAIRANAMRRKTDYVQRESGHRSGVGSSNSCKQAGINEQQPGNSKQQRLKQGPNCRKTQIATRKTQIATGIYKQTAQ